MQQAESVQHTGNADDFSVAGCVLSLCRFAARRPYKKAAAATAAAAAAEIPDFVSFHGNHDEIVYPAYYRDCPGAMLVLSRLYSCMVQQRPARGI
eukprot:1162054-Pelagomonas_calceolata.AAC.3